MYQLKVNQQQTIIALRLQGWSKRRIARELGYAHIQLARRVARQCGLDLPTAGAHAGHGEVALLIGDAHGRTKTYL